MVDLLINGKDAYSTWGVRMGAGFLNAIDTPCQMKDFIENESRLENGKRVIINPKVSSRNLTLPFTIEGDSITDFQSKKKSFYEELYKGTFDVQIPAMNSEVFHLVFVGASTSYAQNRSMTFCKFSAKFEEPDPSNRL